jgi:hypothetical protein
MNEPKGDTTRVQTIPGLSADDEPKSRDERQKLDTANRSNLPLFRLKNASEEAALNKLCSGTRNKRAFRRLVLAYLQLIADTVSQAETKKTGTRRSTLQAALRRRAQTVRVFSKKMEKPLPGGTSDRLGIIPPLPPVRELYEYANSLEKLANGLRSASGNQPPRHRPRPESRLIVSLAEFVRRQKGSSCWASLSILLRRPVGVEFNEGSLKALVTFHRTKARRSRIYSAVWFPRSFTKD